MTSRPSPTDLAQPRAPFQGDDVCSAAASSATQRPRWRSPRCQASAWRSTALAAGPQLSARNVDEMAASSRPAVDVQLGRGSLPV